MATLLDGRYALGEKPVASGGHALLYRGSDMDRDNDIVAVKIFRGGHLHDDRILTAAWTAELTAYQQIREDENLAKLLDFGRDDEGAPYLVFEWMPSDLAKYLPTLELTGWDDFWPIARGILRGLAVLHSGGFVHRDIKPGNVLIDSEGRIKVADFGTARLVQTLNLGLTMAPFGTEPYAPPERMTSSPTFAYDVFSFAVLAIESLSASSPNSTAEFLLALQELNIPEPVRERLHDCLNVEPESRPESATTFLASLEAIQDARNVVGRSTKSVHLVVSPKILADVSETVGIEPNDARRFLLDDLQNVGAMAFDNPSVKNGAELTPDLMICGETLMVRVQVDRIAPSMLRVHRVVRSITEEKRDGWYRPSVKFRGTTPTDPAAVESDLNVLLEDTQEYDRDRARRRPSVDEFRTWRDVLAAKFSVEDRRGSKIRYISFRVSGNRVYFKCPEINDIKVGEARLVSSGRRRVFFGEVEGIENSELVLYLTKGKFSDLPAKGIIELDTEGNKSKLRREKSALDRISDQKSARSDLRELLLEPEISAPPVAQTHIVPVQDGLDSAKLRAVENALGNNDFLLVQGPPGTGKTTFIAEVVAQTLIAKADSRILLASQTHIALDNALERIAAICPEATLLRLGKSERVMAEVEPYTVDAAVEIWRTRVEAAGRSYLQQLAESLGINTNGQKIRDLAAELTGKISREKQHATSVESQNIERNSILEQMDQLSALAPALIEAALKLESASHIQELPALNDAVDQFVRAGSEVAAIFEATPSLSTELVLIEQRLSGLRRELEALQTAKQNLRRSLIAMLELSSDIKSEDLLKIAAVRAPIHDPRLDRLRVIQEDWRARFGTGHEFVGIVVAGSNVVAATCVGLAGVQGAENIDFDMCIIDEASKATATESLVPLAASKRWILVGDDRQLPPFVEDALNDPSILDQHNLSRDAVRETLFNVLLERLPLASKVALTHQHRMHPTIGRLISKCFYAGSLTSEPREASKIVGLGVSHPVTWFDTSNRPGRFEAADGNSYLNRDEVRVVVSILQRMQWVAERQKINVSVAVLTGYEPQRRILTESISAELTALSRLTVQVANIDAYQGQEADVAIFSVTRSNKKHAMGFLSVENRVNVALSRARDALVIVGDAEHIKASSGTQSALGKVLEHIASDSDSAVEDASSI
ncbi:hypothetical protein CH260_24790 [Rhodococcus sp. 05-2256-B2]|uniref:serine/threonine-protein kinase n=1 Tax=unclassified Rhodococcus (in: high G+C Gram-positive bacteria) TaxID=192944 RepID=UPI000B9C49EA|nr:MULTISPECIES: serine/threonine-protein kinase [unclassified Rhodococcus (in: high G+C Gram-positive bacteria)]OZD87762.1 hypothetical protein CH258_10150 [Rhodococcus sp. 05-2256-B4]OZD89948.1 hypothetical protein CH260_24790 [Rhodococcus sp. 05-2256-B2]OZD92266.1 hypothetical protein CH257_14340 [Rhodococcus sp. 05-2256-B3]OZD98971.1 hypothetical protein CH285_22795 [Rhodococcus sp. 05-2256-B1]